MFDGAVAILPATISIGQQGLRRFPVSSEIACFYQFFQRTIKKFLVTIEIKESLSEAFMRYFSVEMADTPALKNLVYWIRYRVYCREFKFEPEARFPDGLEFDEYDQFSRFCLIRHRNSGAPAGCVRMVPALQPRETLPLPFEKHCAGSLDQQALAAMKFDRSTVCEVSRLAVDTAFRRRDGELLTRFGEIEGMIFSSQERRTFSMIAVALFLAAVAMTEAEHRTNVFAMMEPFLPRMLDKAGIRFQRIGKDMDFHGIRAPYFITTQSAVANLPEEYEELYLWVKQSLFN